MTITQSLENKPHTYIQYFPTKEIYYDEEFNSRGYIVPMDVIELARDILQKGLVEPIILRRNFTVPVEGKTANLVAGFRRLKAVAVVNKSEFIKAMVYDELTDLEAQTVNLSENLNRKNLNIMQEAYAVKKMKLFGLNRQEIAEEANVSEGWVQIREMALALPEEIQEYAKTGQLTQTHIRDLFMLRSRDKQLEAVITIKKAKANNEVVRVREKPKKASTRRRREISEIEEMMSTIRESLGNSLTTRVLAWAAGTLTDIEIQVDIREACKAAGKPYTIPSDYTIGAW